MSTAAATNEGCGGGEDSDTGDGLPAHAIGSGSWLW